MWEFPNLDIGEENGPITTLLTVLMEWTVGNFGDFCMHVKDEMMVVSARLC